MSEINVFYFRIRKKQDSRNSDHTLKLNCLYIRIKILFLSFIDSEVASRCRQSSLIDLGCNEAGATSVAADALITANTQTNAPVASAHVSEETSVDNTTAIFSTD